MYTSYGPLVAVKILRRLSVGLGKESIIKDEG